MEEPSLAQRILDHVGRSNYQPVKPRLIARQLQFPKDQTAEVKKAIKQLVRQGRLNYGSNHLVMPGDPSSPQSSRVVGVFRRKDNGYGFVRPTATTAEGDGGEVADIYVAAKRSGDAATGDLVLVQLLRQRARDPGPRGEIVEILERETHHFVGAYFESAGGAYVEIDGALFAQPIYVGDPGAKNAQPDDKVVIEMVRFPSPLRAGEGVITEVLGPRGTPGVDTLSIIREFNLPDAFAEDALEEAHEAAQAFDESIPDGRVDLTGETVITIDPVDARDFDDAISLKLLPNGHWELGVHIADVAYFVRPRTALDREAHNRATSVYLPDRVLPMLPETISNSLASLQPGKIRYTKSAIMEFTADGIRVATQVHSAAIRSDKRLAYEEVDQFLADPKPWLSTWGKEVHQLLSQMHTLAMILRKRRFAGGSLELTMPEVKVDLDHEGRVSGRHVVKHTESHQIIEEFMLAANEAVAELLAEKKIPFLRRIHEPPEPRKLKILTEFVNELGFQADSLQNRFELQKLLDQVANRPEEHAVNFAILRSLKRAVYSPMEEGHYALASERYCHFTSPIRRYPDLSVHRLLDALLEERTPQQHLDELIVLGQHCSDREQRAETAERELTKAKLLDYLSQRIGKEMDGVVTGVESFGLFVQGIELPAEGLIRVDALTDDYYDFDRAAHTLSGHRSGNTYRLGDKLRVCVARVDLDRRELDFRVVERQAPTTKKRSKTPSIRAKNISKTKRKSGRRKK